MAWLVRVSVLCLRARPALELWLVLLLANVEELLVLGKVRFNLHTH